MDSWYIFETQVILKVGGSLEKNQHSVDRGSERWVAGAGSTQEPCSQPGAKWMSSPPEVLIADIG